jgi:ABC-2 type transport system permease protein
MSQIALAPVNTGSSPTVAFRTLLAKEMLRFWKVNFQTIAAPVLTAVLYLLVFGQVLAEHVEAFPVSATCVPDSGLVMSVLQNVRQLLVKPNR